MSKAANGNGTKSLRILAAAAALALTLSAPGALRAAQNGPAAAGDTITQPFVHLYSDANGVSHFRDEVLTISRGASGPARLGLSESSTADLLALKHGAKEDWHRAPHRMYLIALSGMSEVTTGDGQVRRFGPGSILLMDDTTGKGHITRAVGKVDHVAITVSAPAP